MFQLDESFTYGTTDMSKYKQKHTAENMTFLE